VHPAYSPSNLTLQYLCFIKPNTPLNFHLTDISPYRAAYHGTARLVNGNGPAVFEDLRPSGNRESP